MIEKLQEYLIVALAGLLVGGLGAWWVQGLRIDGIRADALKDKEKAVSEERDRADQISNDYAKVVEWLNGKRQSNTAALVKELENPAYRDTACVLPESGRVLVNDAVRQANAARLGGAVLPEAAGAAGGREDGRDPALVGVGGGGLRGMLRWKSQADPVGDGVR